MQATDKAKSFAFKLATEMKQKDESRTTWQTRDGVAVAGCTDPTREGDYRYSTILNGRDAGAYC